MAQDQELPTLEALAEVLPASLIRDVLTKSERHSLRRRKLPAEAVTWLVIAMALFRRLSVVNVLRQLVGPLRELLWWGPAEVPHATSISKARDRLGWETVRLLFQRFAALLRAQTPTRWRWRGLEVLTLDGTAFLAPDTNANDAFFGRPGASRGGRSGFPQLRAVMLMEAWTHVMIDAAFGPFRTSEQQLAEQLLGSLRNGTVLLLDRAFESFAWLWSVRCASAHFVVRVRSGRCTNRAAKKKHLARNDYVGELRVPKYLKRKRPELPDVLEVRVVTLPRRGYRPLVVMTSLLDPVAYPATAVIELYYDRWEAELAYRELKIHMGEPPVAFRSQTPTRVLQEAYGHLIAYNAVRALMARAAEERDLKPHRLSFVDCLERVRWAVRDLTYSDDGTHPDLALERLLDDMGRCALPPRRTGRRCDRAVKIKMSSYPRKRHGLPSAPTSRQRNEKRRAPCQPAG